MNTPFFEKLSNRIRTTGVSLCVGLDPRPEHVPEHLRWEPEPILAWNRAIIRATAHLAAAYKPNIAFYEALGRRGWETLRATIEAVPEDIPVILDAKRGDIGSTAEAYARAVFDELGADAVTLSPYLGRDSVAPFLRRPEKAAFLLCHTSNPGAQDLQVLPVCPPDRPPVPLYLEIARRVVTWSEHPNVGLVVGATYPEALAAVRRAVPETWFLVPGVGNQGGQVEALRVGLRADGLGLLVNVSRGIALAPDPGTAAETYAAQLRPLLTEPVPRLVPPDPVEELTLALHDLNAIRFGQFILTSGRLSPIYIDLRLLVAAPTLMAQTAQMYARHVRRLHPDLLAGVPYAALPIATAVSLHTGVPMIYPRKEAKRHGLARQIEGQYAAGQRVVVIEDLITTGGSTLHTITLLREAGLVARDVVVLIDREQGGVEHLAEEGITVHAILRLSDMLQILQQHDRLTPQQVSEVRQYMERERAQT